MDPSRIRRLETARDGAIVARLGFGAREGFAGAPGVTGFVGWYEATDGEAGTALLRRAVATLFEEGADRVVGPLDGSTWHRYRLVVPHGSPAAPGDPPFLGEPSNPPEYVDQFIDAGFRPHLEYESRVVRAPRADAGKDDRERLAERRISIAGVEPDRFEEVVGEIHALSLAAFAENPFFTPLPLAEFTAMHGAMLALIDPRLVRLARERDGRLLGYVFAYADPLAPARVILKTLATHPDTRGLGMGGALTRAVDAEAGRRGAAVVHALMQVTNSSMRISARSESALLRGYNLFIVRP